MWNKHMRVTEVGKAYNSSRTISIRTYLGQLGEVLVISYYGRVDDEGRMTRTWLAQELPRLLADRLPFIIMGDLNLPSSEVCQVLQQYGMGRTKLVSPGPTCFTSRGGSAIDMIILGGEAAKWAGKAETIETGLATHRPIRMQIDSEIAEQRVDVFVKPPAVKVGQPVVGPNLVSRKWDIFRHKTGRALASTQGARHMGEAGNAVTDEELTDLMDGWWEAVREELQALTGCFEASMVGEPFQGKATTLGRLQTQAQQERTPKQIGLVTQDS